VPPPKPGRVEIMSNKSFKKEEKKRVAILEAMEELIGHYEQQILFINGDKEGWRLNQFRIKDMAGVMEKLKMILEAKTYYEDYILYTNESIV